MEDQSPETISDDILKPVIDPSSGFSSQVEGRIEHFAQALRLLTREVLRSSRCNLLLESSSFILLLTPKKHYTYRIDKNRVPAPTEYIRRAVVSKIGSNSFLRNLLQHEEDSLGDVSTNDFDQPILVVKSRVPVLNYITDTSMRKRLEKTFSSRAGDARNLFMEIARENYELSEIQSYLRLNEEDLLWMITWGVEEKLLFIEGDTENSDTDENSNESSSLAEEN
ncbi:MAG: hypothetical protein ACFFB3_06720 [Candidatus Hodarchaeota archaeon]